MPALGETKVRLDRVRLSFATNLWTPRQSDGKDSEGKNPANMPKPKYSTSMLLPQDHPDLGVIKKAMKAAADAKWGKDAEKVYKSLVAADRLAIHDGDAKSDKYDYYADMLYINASNVSPPKIRDMQLRELTEEDGKPYSGCYCNVVLDFWAQDHKQFGRRINASLLGVQFVEDGERLGGSGGVAEEDDFEVISPADAADAFSKEAAAADTGGIGIFE